MFASSLLSSLKCLKIFTDQVEGGKEIICFNLNDYFCHVLLPQISSFYFCIMEKMKHSQVKTRSMARQDSTTVDNVTQRFQRVSTEENLEDLQKDIGINKKHKLSTAGIDTAMTSKKLRHGQLSQEQLMKTTRAVIEKLLQKETTSTPTKRQPRKSKRKSRSKKSPIACTFSEAGVNKGRYMFKFV